MIIDTNFQTPPEVCRYMASLIPESAITVYEPTPGLGNLVEAAEDRLFDVTAAYDFFTEDHSKQYDCIIMNPPFGSKSAHMEHAPEDLKGMRLGYWILTKCMEMSDNVIALMPWFTISDSDVRLRFLKAWGLKSLTVLPRKTFQYARIQTVVIELEKGFTGDTLFKTLE